jgi:hypothetical protein
MLQFHTYDNVWTTASLHSDNRRQETAYALPEAYIESITKNRQLKIEILNRYH